MRGDLSQPTHLMINRVRLERAHGRAWSVLKHGAVQAVQSRFDSGLAYQRVQCKIAETRKDSADSSDRAE